MQALVAGGAGFIGSHLVRALLKAGNTVRVLDNFSTGSMDNLEEVKHRIDLIDGDIRKPKTVKQAMEEVHLVFHQAALASVQRSMKNPMATAEVNVVGTLNVLEAARAVRVRRLVFASSSSVYGEYPDPVRREGMPLKPMSPYALSKLVGEQYCALYSRAFGLETVALRYFNVFGPRQDPGNPYAAVIPKVTNALLSGGRAVIYGDGEQSRDFSFIDNVVQANLLAAKVEGISGRVFNIGCGESLSINALYETLTDLLEVDSIPTYQPAQAGDVRFSQADISLAAEHLGYAPSVDVREGLRRTLAWYRAQANGRSHPAPLPPAAAVRRR